MGRGSRHVVATVVLVLCWGSTFAAVKIGLRSSPPITFAGLRCLFAGLVIGAVALARRGPPTARGPSARGSSARGQAATFGWLTLGNVVGFVGLQVIAVGLLPSGLSAVLIYLQPVLVAGLAWPLLHERLSALAALGLLLAFGGVVVVSAAAAKGHVSLPGIACAVGSALAWALGTITYKHRAGTVDPWWAVGIPLLVGGPVLLVLGVVTERPDIDWSWGFVAALAFTVLAGSAFSWLLWFRLIAVRGAARAAATIYFVPLVALVIGVLALGERLRASLALGSALVVLGVYLVNRPERDGTEGGALGADRVTG